MNRPVRIAHISDLHLTGISKNDDDIIARISAKLEAIARDTQLDFLVVSGDLIDGPSWKKHHHTNFLRGCLERLTGLRKYLSNDNANRVRVVPGNHDLRHLGLLRRTSSLNIFMEIFGENLKPYVDPELKIVFAGFNTNLPTKSIDTATGTFRPLDIAAFDDWLKSQPESIRTFPRVAITHHHPMPVADSEVGSSGIIDQTDYLRFRNAGTLLKRLLSSGFHVLLHGHLHVPEHWTVSSGYSVAPTAAQHSLEIIGAGSAGKTGSDGKYSLNVISVFDLGWVEAISYEFGDVGGSYSTKELVHRTFENVRPGIVASALLANGKLPFKCKSVVVDVKAYPRTGFVSSKIQYIELLKKTQESINFEIETSSTSMVNRPIVSARCIDTGQLLKASFLVQSIEAGIPTFKHAIDLRRLGSNLVAENIACTIHSSGAIFGTSQHAKWFNPNKARQDDFIGFKVRLKQDLLNINLYFKDSDRDIIPTRFVVKVLDVHGKEVESEASSKSVILISHRPWSGADGVAAKDKTVRHGGPDATLHVFRPIVGFTYQVSWELPDRFDKDAEPNRDLRSFILKPTPHGRKDLKPVITKFLEDIAGGLRELLSKHSNISSEQFDIYLFGFDPVDGVSSLTESINDSGDETFKKGIDWGKSIVGECVRYRRPILWPRPYQGEQPGESYGGPSPGREVGISSQVMAVYTLPIWPSAPSFELIPLGAGGGNIPYVPVGIIAVTSMTTTSRVIALLKQRGFQEKFIGIAEKSLDKLKEGILPFFL